MTNPASSAVEEEDMGPASDETAAVSQEARPEGPSPTGWIVPRKSWPRPATPADLVPNWAGEFRDFDDWVNFATNRLTGTYDPMMGNEVSAICVDALGRRCSIGGHFRRAKEEGAFPVRFFWDCSLPDDQSASERSDAATVEVTNPGRNTQ
jgi:hypothetical protein